VDGNDALPVALNRILDRIMADNPISTLELGLFHNPSGSSSQTRARPGAS